MRLVERMQIVSAVVPVDLQAAQDGDWVSLSHYSHVTVIFHKGIGTPGDDPTVRMQQAQDTSGTGAKDLNYSQYWLKQGTLTSIGQFTKVTQSSSASTALNSSSAESEIIMVLEFDYKDLDTANSFDCVRFRVDDTGTNEQLGSALYLLHGERIAAEAQPSVLT